MSFSEESSKRTVATAIFRRYVRLIKKVVNLLDYVAEEYDIKDKKDFKCKHLRTLAEEINWRRGNKFRSQ